jgi:hypothetical protein
VLHNDVFPGSIRRSAPYTCLNASIVAVQGALRRPLDKP